MTYLYLCLAIVAEVLATSALKSTEEFTRLYPSLVVIVGYGFAFYFITLTLKTLPIGMTYAIWSGLGIVLITLIGVWKFHEIPNVPTMIGMGLIIAGVGMMHMFSNHG